MQFSEKTHNIVSLPKILNGEVFSPEIQDNVRLLKDNQTSDYTLFVMEQLDGNTQFFDLTKNLRKKDIRPMVNWVSREYIKKISDSFSSAESANNDSQTDAQQRVLDIIKYAVELRASDIHFRIESTFFKVLFRIDGVLRVMRKFEASAEEGKMLIQTLYNSMCDERSESTFSYNEPTDAKIREVFVAPFGLSTGRFASRPGSVGTILVVVRLISRRKSQLELESLGLTVKQTVSIRRALSKPNGVIFSSGPTGHGKSTLSQCMAESLLRDNPGINLVTVEDPIESPIAGAVQTPLIIADRSDRALMGRAYSKAISNLMRLDPDCIYIGEVRDSTSATGVIESAQTGHSVITTIHTSYPIDIIQRLRRLGVDQDLLTDATLITCLIGLRLTPLLCPQCKKSYSDHKESIDVSIRSLIEQYTTTDTVFLINDDGCKHCDYTGINGRTGVFEVIETDYKFMQLYGDKGKIEAWDYWRKKGGETLCENITRLINLGRVDPVLAHKNICNLDRDDKLHE
ncbi:pilus assembly protein PilQ (plasmid) [Candidatus Symbiopectobacterium sp. 'North America']|uniref:GspE/PulE family protein n=1 Tax=Candidatus Symbiopectobacterium sp. 'North America' TaxID=2794574 RepID=UPI0018CA1C05|nr:ATPase, T2SS/T4P/T4SS family [Candidatus Symbiopectobacterium sp. 'North America']MBG6246666.1 pilus assembly protein PilQ [Candidatus Symbiopectobacterium sp. 'North America']